VNSFNVSNIGQELSDTESVSTNKESNNLNFVFEHQIVPLSKNAIQRNKNIKKLLEEQSTQQKKSFKSAIDAEPVTVFDKPSKHKLRKKLLPTVTEEICALQNFFFTVTMMSKFLYNKKEIKSKLLNTSYRMNYI
jgi:hypothetical protein